MKPSDSLFKAIVDTVLEHIVMLDHHGVIQFVNQAWINFGNANGYAASSAWQGLNYLTVCDQSAAGGDLDAKLVAAGIRAVIAAKTDNFYYEYPCPSAQMRRWFMMRAHPLKWEGQTSYIISHHDITERKLAEEQAASLALVDGLTGVANRRHFDDVLGMEWRRAARDGKPLSLILLDIDHFKLFNDTYGHQAGDRCLQRVALVLGAFARRPGDFAARYGGEEFALILSAADEAFPVQIAERLLLAIWDLNIAHERLPETGRVTASIGVATMTPGDDLAEDTLVASADKSLYAAKNDGRNRVCVSDSS